MKQFVIIIFILIVSGCAAPKIYEMTAAETDFVSKFSDSCDCQVSIEKDYNVQYHDSKEGTAYIIMNYNKSKRNYCLSDSLQLWAFSKITAKYFAGIMDNKESYKNIAVNFYSSDLSVQGMETPTCDITFIFDRVSNNAVQ